jgi:hypothetical protein
MKEMSQKYKRTDKFFFSMSPVDFSALFGVESRVTSKLGSGLIDKMGQKLKLNNMPPRKSTLPRTGSNSRKTIDALGIGCGWEADELCC